MHPTTPPLILLAAALTLGAACTADLRPEPLAQTSRLDPQDPKVARGRELLEQLPEAHGGLETWRAHRTARVRLTDTWPRALSRAAAMPWPSNGALLEHDVLLGTDTSRLSFPDGELAGQSWGIQSWVTYTVEGGGAPVLEEHEDAWFWLPTVEYFVEAPFRLHEAQHVAHAGKSMVHGAEYEVVYLTWGSVEPNTESDQYVAYIDPQTGRLAMLSYTVRDLARFLTGTAYYRGYHDVQGIAVPDEIVIATIDDPEDVLHRMKIDQITYGVDLDEAYFYPFPRKSAAKGDRGEAR